VTPLDRVGTGVIGPQTVALDHVGEVVTDLGRLSPRCRRVRSENLVRGGRGGDRTETYEEGAGHHGRPFGNEELVDDAVGLGLDRVLHLHRLEDEQLLPGTHGVTLGDEQPDDGSLQRRRDLRHTRCLADVRIRTGRATSTRGH
jgi:hypothetical protein